MTDWTAEQRPIGVADVEAMADMVKGRSECRLGHHAWVPWLQLPSGSMTTWCAREGCDHTEQFDF